MLESSQRIQQLGEVYARRKPPLTDPGPPMELPPWAATANPFRQASAIPQNIKCWDLRATTAPQHGLADWLAFHVVVMGMASVPLAVWAAEPAIREHRAVCRDVKDGLYSRGLYYICKLLMELPVLICLGLAYLAPAYAMSGAAGGDTGQAFLRYLGLTLLYWLAAHAIMLFWLSALRSRLRGTLVAVALHWLLLLVSGFPLHLGDLSPVVSWLQWASPARWLLPPLVTPELAAVSSVTCKAVQFPWSEAPLVPAAVTALIACAWTLLAFIAWCLRTSPAPDKRKND
ncbi:hypothetical protein B566_EDAN007262 [Ephemera danica]|nr:hypothetical protein B566_EDAN007262 [Ephemera danica]